MAKLGSSWGAEEELMHPRGKDGRFISKAGVGMLTAVAKRIAQLLGRIDYREFGSDQQASQYLFNSYKDWPEADKQRLLADLHDTNVQLHAGRMDASTQKFVDMMDRQLQPADSDLILHRSMGPEAFGIDPALMDAEDGGVWDLPGKVVSSKGYTPTRIGTPGSGGPIHMAIVAPKGTKIAPTRNGPNDRGVMMDRDLPIRITKVDRDGRGGYHITAIIDTEGGGETPHPLVGTERETGATPEMREGRATAPAPLTPSRRALGEQEQIAREQERIVANTPEARAERERQSIREHQERMGPSPTGPTDTGPGGPPPRNEPILKESVGGGPSPEVPTPEAAPEEPIRTVDFRAAFDEAGIGAPSDGPRRRQFNKAYEGVTSGKRRPEDALRELEADIAVNDRQLAQDKLDGVSDKDREFERDIQIQKQLADLIAEQHGLERGKREQEGPKPTPSKQDVSEQEIIQRAQRVREGEPSEKPILEKAAQLQREKEIKTGRRHMTVTQARHRTALEAIDKNKIPGDEGGKYREIASKVEGGEWTVTRARFEAKEESKRRRNAAGIARTKADNASGQRARDFRREADEEEAVADKYDKLREDLLTSQSVTATDKYVNPPEPKKVTPGPVKAVPTKRASVGPAPSRDGVVLGKRYGNEHGWVGDRAGQVSKPGESKIYKGWQAFYDDHKAEADKFEAERVKARSEKLPFKHATPAKPVRDATDIDQMTKDELLADPRAAGAAKSWTKDRIKAHIRGETPAPVKRAPAKKAAPKPVRDVTDIEQMTVAELKKFAEDNDIGGVRPSWNKQRIKDHIRQVQDFQENAPGRPLIARRVEPTPEPIVQNPVAQKPIEAPDRVRGFDEAWDAKGFEAPQGSANRSLQEVREDIATGRITPDEGIRRLETEIQLNSEEMIDMDQTLRGDLTPEERQDLMAQRKQLGQSIRAQADASKFLRDHFKKAPEVTPDEVKIAIVDSDTPEARTIGDMLRDATPEDVRDMKSQLKTEGYGDIEGDTAEEVFDNAIKKMIQDRLKELEAEKKKPEKPLAPAPKAPEKRKPNLEGSKYQRIDARALAEGLDLRDEHDVRMLDTVQRMLDGDDDTIGKNPTPAQIGRYLDTWRRGPGGPATQAVMRESITRSRSRAPGETDADIERRNAEAEAEAAPARKRDAEWKKLADRLMNTRRQRARDPEPDVQPALTKGEIAEIQNASEITGIPFEEMERRTLGKKQAEAPPKQSAQQVAETLKTVGSRKEAEDLLQGRTKAELLEILKAQGVPGPRRGSKATKADITTDIVELEGARLDGNALRNLGRGGQAEPGEPRYDIPKAGSLTRQDLMDADLETIKRIEDDMGIKRHSLNKGDRVDAIIQKAGGPGGPEPEPPGGGASLKDLAKEAGLAGDAGGLVPSRELDLKQGMSRTEVAAKIRRDADSLEKAPMGAESSDPSIAKAAREQKATQVAKLRRWADLVEGKGPEPEPPTPGGGKEPEVDFTDPELLKSGHARDILDNLEMGDTRDEIVDMYVEDGIRRQEAEMLVDEVIKARDAQVGRPNLRLVPPLPEKKPRVKKEPGRITREGPQLPPDKDGLSQLDDRDLRDLAVEYGIPAEDRVFPLKSEDRSFFLAELRDRNAVSPAVQQRLDRLRDLGVVEGGREGGGERGKLTSIPGERKDEPELPAVPALTPEEITQRAARGEREERKRRFDLLQGGGKGGEGTGPGPQRGGAEAPAARPTIDESVPLAGDPEGDNSIMHGDSATMNLAQAYAKKNRNGTANRLMELRRQISTQRGEDSKDLQGPQKMVDELKQLREVETDDQLRQKLDEAIKELDFPKRPIPDLPEGTPPALRKLLENLNEIPVARAIKGSRLHGHTTSEDSPVDRIAQLFRQIEDSKGQVSFGEIERQIEDILRTYHESIDGAYRMWGLWNRVDDDKEFTDQLRTWIRGLRQGG